jgi:glycine cleavage system H protein
MSIIRGFEFPDDLYYLIETHVWVRLRGDGTAQLGLTPVAYQMLRNSIVAISVKTRIIGQQVAKGKSLAMVESLKYIGPLAAPFDGLFLRGNELLDSDPDVAERDPYGDGWIAEMRPADWDLASRDLVTGPAALEAYESFLDSTNISPD